MKWPSNEQVEQYEFGIPEVDSIKSYDYYARASLIAREITVKDYLLIEGVRQVVLSKLESFQGKMSKEGRNVLREILSAIS